MNKVKSILLFLTLLLFVFSFTPKALAEVTITPWDTTTQLPYLLASQTSYIYNSKLYIIAGSAETGNDRDEIISSTQNSDGTISNWTNNSAVLPEATLLHATSTSQDKKFVYVLGGSEENPGSAMGIVNTVFVGLTNSLGDITSWQASSNPIPYPAILGQAIVIGNRIYFAGGEDDGGTIHSDISFATINNDGSLNTWQLAGNLPVPLKSFSMLVDNSGNILIIGGQTTDGIPQSAVYKTSLQTDGTINSWQTMTPLPQTFYRGGAVLEGNTIFVVGGFINDTINPAIRSNKVFIGELDSGNNLGAWIESPNSLPLSACCGTLNYLNGYLYWAGGYDTTQGYVDNVYYAKVTNGNTNTGPLSVPYFSQKSQPWGSTEYDHAQSLDFSPINMSQWGCAVTSAAMVLKFYGMNALPNGTALDPGSLNQWLNANNGYLTGKDSSGNYSYLDWTSIGKLARAAQLAGKSPTDVMVKVIRAPSENTFSSQFDADFAQQIPDIVQTHSALTSSHFVVTTGKTTNSYTINDPFWNNPTLASFNNNVDEVVRLIPSHTDLSYITIVVDPTVNIFVTDANGEREGNNGSQTFDEIPNAVYGPENPIGSPTDNSTFGIGVNRLLLPTPMDGNYTITLSSQTAQTFTLNISTIETDGTSQIKTISGVVDPQDSSTFTLNYSNTQPSTTSATAVTVQSTINDINALYQLHLISFSTYTALSATLQNALTHQKSHPTTEKGTINADESIILSQKNSGGITQSTYNILHADFLALEQM